MQKKPISTKHILALVKIGIFLFEKAKFCEITLV